MPYKRYGESVSEDMDEKTFLSFHAHPFLPSQPAPEARATECSWKVVELACSLSISLIALRLLSGVAAVELAKPPGSNP
jgi:hypothetical protein